MNETTASATNAKIAKHMTDTFGLPKYEMPKMEIPAEFREITDKGVRAGPGNLHRAISGVSA